MTSAQGPDGVGDFFGTGANRYDSRHYGSGHRTFFSDRLDLVTQVFTSLGLPPGAMLLDVACGPGHFLQAAVAAGANATGVDRSRDMLGASATRLGCGARLVQGDAAALPFESATFDVLNCSGLIEYYPDPAPMLLEFRRVVRPGGTLIVSSTNRRSPALALDSLIEAARRTGLPRRLARILGLGVDDVSLRARPFRMTFHTPEELSARLTEVGLEAVELRYCHLQLLPHPLDHVIPAVTTAVVRSTDRFLSASRLRGVAEGLVAIARRPA